MIKYKILTLACMFALLVSCSDQVYYDVPLDPNGKVVITGISKASTTGLTLLDAGFTVNVTFATAKPGDVMKAELLKLQVPTAAQGGGTDLQLLPIAGALKDVTVGADLKAAVTFTRAEATIKAGEYVSCTFSGKTDAAIQRVDLVTALALSSPKFSGKDVTIMRLPDAGAVIPMTISPKAAAFSGTLTVTRKNAFNDAWVAVGTYNASPANVPISGANFAVGKDTMYYRFVATQGTFSEETITKVVVSTPAFFLKKTGVTLTQGGSAAGRNILTNGGVAATAATAMLTVTNTLTLQGGAAWLAAKPGNIIEFVPTTSAVYNANKSLDVIAAFAAGVKTTTADPAANGGLYIYRAVNGPNPSDVYYGMVKVTSIVPGTSVALEYLIGDQYAHLLTVI